ncbi:MAG TPA: stage 0 sporulation family protein [bacterium]|nr:stage 0 sporulation family protein [bacterium]
MQVIAVTVRLRQMGSFEQCACRHLWLDPGNLCIVGSKGRERFGRVVSGPKMTDPEKLSSDQWEVLRLAKEDDFKKVLENEKMERDAFEACRQLIKKRELLMKLVRVEYAFDRSQALFYFTAETRVDFRELVRDLAHQFRTRIELKQVGVRDEAKILGGIGYCGRELCCKAFLHNFQPVSKKMARDQNLTLNPSKISGVCGRLLCCLVYEESMYEELSRGIPKEGAAVETPSGPGKVKTVNPLKQTVDVQLASGVTKCFEVADVKLVKANGAPESVIEPDNSGGNDGTSGPDFDGK